ncbi:uncharacterized protein AMSG_00589 [Thecamonas trahens ATCC 50062]|uniref:Laminin EGF-like domain-containing protein n=1 Tax=Thecamonas trahens ATCC 50062 TaxID=461836 RepID=A0A0L0D8Y9_THETB|nr:hypothetical protein AMSG_00589 [Thecamonas trahens ATCC 50062]KNC48809.1 hypothetical protein AMSG_00589 [Thecamonas trahens ATCC 50062]|eukprot:XP_013762860.1 hypothetical protein AMSG_00589 [Thecamonas trahens ATCC 50062]
MPATSLYLSSLTPGTEYLFTFVTDADENADPIVGDVSFTTPCPDPGTGRLNNVDGCQLCPRGAYSPANTAECTACVAGTTTTAPGATSVVDCICDVGAGWRDDGNGEGECMLCAADSFKDAIGDAPCEACGANSTTLSAIGATLPSSCLCQPGFEALPLPPPPPPPPLPAPAPSPALVCSLCPPGTYRSGFSSSEPCVACPGSSLTIAPGSKSVSDCLCPPGTFGSPFNCTQCPVGTYSAEHGVTASCVACPTGSTTAASGSLNATACSVCEAGYFGPNCDPCPGCVFGCDDGERGTGACSCGADTGLLQPGCTTCSSSWFGAACNQTCTCVNGVCDSGFTGTGACLECDFGFAGADCSSCAQGFDPASLCSACAAGHDKAPGLSPCLPCRPGTYQQTPGSGLDCIPCPSGFFQTGSGAHYCDICPAGTFSVSPRTAACTGCGPGRSSSPGSTALADCSDCPIGSYKADAGAGECLACPGTSTTAVAGASSVALCGCVPGEGYDAVSESCAPCDAAAGEVSIELDQSACTPCAVCAGGGTPPQAAPGYYPGACLRGHTGFRCGTCASGFYKDADSGHCKDCPRNIVAVFVVLFTCAAIGCVVLVRIARSAHGYFTAASIGFNFLQVISVLASFPRLRLPGSLKQLFRVLSAVNIDLQLFRPECMVSDSKAAYHIIWAIKVSTPAIMLIIFVAAWGCVWSWAKCRGTMPAEKLQSWKYAFTNASVTMMFILYLMVSNTALEIFPCTRLPDGQYVMDREPSVVCYSSTWFRQLAASLAVLICYSLAMPLVVGTVLFRRRENLWKRKNQAKYGLLFARYRPAFFLFELAILGRKFGVIFGKVLFAHSVVWQVVFALLVVALSLGLQLRLRPYSTIRINRLETLMLVAAEVVLALAVAFAVANGTFSFGTICLLATGVFLAVGLAVIVLAVAVTLELRKTFRLKKRGIVGKFAIDKVDVLPAFFGAELGIRVVGHEQAPAAITLRLTTENAVGIAAQTALEKEFVRKSELNRSWQSYLAWLRPASRDAAGAQPPVYQGVTSVGHEHELVLRCETNGYYTVVLAAVPAVPAPRPPLPPATRARRAWEKLVALVDGSAFELAMAPDMVRLIMAQGAERLISMRLTMSPEWSAAESVVGAGASTSAKVEL